MGFEGGMRIGLDGTGLAYPAVAVAAGDGAVAIRGAAARWKGGASGSWLDPLPVDIALLVDQGAAAKAWSSAVAVAVAGVAVAAGVAGAGPGGSVAASGAGFVGG